jgi:predicted Zn finger-like uncharacterized protein
MITECTNCGTMYEVDDKLLAPVGRKLKCYQCKYIYFQPFNGADDVKPPQCLPSELSQDNSPDHSIVSSESSQNPQPVSKSASSSTPKNQAEISGFFQCIYQALEKELATTLLSQSEEEPVIFFDMKVELLSGESEINSLLEKDRFIASIHANCSCSGEIHVILDAATQISLTGLKQKVDKDELLEQLQKRSIKPAHHTGFEWFIDIIAIKTLKSVIENKIAADSKLFLENTEHYKPGNIIPTIDSQKAYISATAQIQVNDFPEETFRILFSQNFAQALVGVEMAVADTVSTPTDFYDDDLTVPGSVFDNDEGDAIGSDQQKISEDEEGQEEYDDEWDMDFLRLDTDLSPGDKIKGYEIKSTISRSDISRVYLVIESKTGKKFSLKEYFPRLFSHRNEHGEIRPNSKVDAKTYNWGLKQVQKEYDNLARFKHPSLIYSPGSFREKNTIYCVMEYVSGRSLEDILEDRESGSLSYAELNLFFPPLLDALEIIHKAGYMHRNIKPANIMIQDDDSPILVDYGFLRKKPTSDEDEEITSLYSIGYAPFEQYDSSGTSQGPWSDIYAAGATLYQIVTGKMPIDASKRVAAKIRGEPDPLMPTKPDFDYHQDYPEVFLLAIDAALQILEMDRPQCIEEWRAILYLDNDGLNLNF